MPHVFYRKARAGQPDQDLCPLRMRICGQPNRAGGTCAKHTVLGTDMCWQHARQILQVRVGPSQIPNAGQGLFAHHRNARTAEPNPDLPVFQKDQVIIEYRGEIKFAPRMDAMYGDDEVAPYALDRTNGTQYPKLDCACDRCIAAFANSVDPNGANAEFVSRRRPRDRVSHNYVVAKGPISHGQEIVLHYGREYGDPGADSGFGTRRVTFLPPSMREYVYPAGSTVKGIRRTRSPLMVPPPPKRRRRLGSAQVRRRQPR